MQSLKKAYVLWIHSLVGEKSPPKAQKFFSKGSLCPEERGGEGKLERGIQKSTTIGG